MGNSECGIEKRIVSHILCLIHCVIVENNIVKLRILKSHI
jgi:hypothetical protein